MAATDDAHSVRLQLELPMGAGFPHGSFQHKTRLSGLADVDVVVLSAAHHGSKQGQSEDDEAPADQIEYKLLADIAATVKARFDTGQKFFQLAEVLGVPVEDLFQGLEAATAPAPPGADAPSHHLTEGEIAALRKSGALQVDMPTPGARASTRTALRTAHVFASAVNVEQVATMLGKTPGRIRQRLAEGTLLGVRDGRSWRIPAFQFPEGQELPGWEKIMGALPEDVHPLTVQHFLETPTPDLSVDGEPTSPRDWLASGGPIGSVVELAADLHIVP